MKAEHDLVAGVDDVIRRVERVAEGDRHLVQDAVAVAVDDRQRGTRRQAAIREGEVGADREQRRIEKGDLAAGRVGQRVGQHQIGKTALGEGERDVVDHLLADEDRRAAALGQARRGQLLCDRRPIRRRRRRPGSILGQQVHGEVVAAFDGRIVIDRGGVGDGLVRRRDVIDEADVVGDDDDIAARSRIGRRQCPRPRPVDEGDAGREQIAREGERIAGSVGDAQVEARGAGGDGEAGRKRVADQDVEGAVAAAAGVLGDDRERDEIAAVDLRHVAVDGAAREHIRDTVPENRVPALPGGVKAKGATGEGVKTAPGSELATMPFCRTSSGWLSTTSEVPRPTETSPTVFDSRDCNTLLKRRPSPNGWSCTATLKRISTCSGWLVALWKLPNWNVTAFEAGSIRTVGAPGYPAGFAASRVSVGPEPGDPDRRRG